ncbi:MAG: HAD family phosphatase [Thermogutta sp.]|uniref:HAD family hydrolase n=1 Tax=Thermogutta sp. TaxID=1962930 RepID=UPI0019C2DE84|nr:HAD family phosphatase [Thermogutta sp.]MBC7351076.1 HAD family phosphatase [Thermogutta sp.]
MSSTVDFIYFDLGRVIINFDNDRMCRQIAEVTSLSPERIHEILFSTGLQRAFELGQISPTQFYEEFCRLTGCSVPWDRLRQAASDIFWVNTPMLPVVAQLQARCFPLGILSNTCITHFEWCLEHFTILRRGFRVYGLSCEFRLLKPDPQIFLAAAEKAGVAPERIFFTDDIPAHVEAAQRVGFQAVPFLSARQIAEELRRRGVRFNY